MKSKKIKNKNKKNHNLYRKKNCNFTRRFFFIRPFAIILKCQQNPNGGHLKRAKETESKKEAKPCSIVKCFGGNTRIRKCVGKNSSSEMHPFAESRFEIYYRNITHTRYIIYFIVCTEYACFRRKKFNMGNYVGHSFYYRTYQSPLVSTPINNKIFFAIYN